VEKFSGKNSFALWKLKMWDFLVQHGLQKALDGKSKKPTSMTGKDSEDLEARALSTIHFCLADEVLFNIVEEETTTGLWTKLESLYMTKNLSNIIFLKRQLYSLWMKEGMKIVDHLNVFNTLICQLTSMKVKFEDEDKAVMLLCPFPESWDHLVKTVWFNTTNVISYDIVVATLLSEEIRKTFSKETSTVEEMVVKGRSTEGGKDQKGTTKSKSKDSKGKEKCWFCGKSWHLKKDCWKRQQASKEDSIIEVNSDTGMVDEVLSIFCVSPPVFAQKVQGGDG
jgi:hypothetical protein